MSFGVAPNLDDRTAVAAALEALHRRLAEQFDSLRATRAGLGGQLFALEHGLGDGERAVLHEVVRACVRRGVLARTHWLPFVVQAAEVGYRYEGDEYWPTLQNNCPGWEARLGRTFMKQKFTDFALAYGGARPQGRWAGHFSIIAWPITHAILPTDLQRQLARVLYDSRGVLTTDLLADARSLGAALSARSHYASRRFQQFAENTELLGQVAAALLSDAVEESSILPSTLKRIVEDLTAERQARVWLHAARSSAHRIRLRGISTPPRPETVRRMRPSALVTAPVELTAEPNGAGWTFQVAVPDFTPLLERHPELADELRSIRCMVNGAASRPQARGWLLYAASRVALESWPTPDSPVFQLERPTNVLRDRMDEEARFPLSESWLFKLDSENLGRRIRSGLAQAGSRYLVVGQIEVEAVTEWMTPVAVEFADVSAVLVSVPRGAGPAEHDALQRVAGIGLQSSVRVEPVGLLPAQWDGQGYAEWLVGERPLLRVEVPHEISTCTIALDGGDSELLTWGPDLELVIQLPELGEGPHSAVFGFVTVDNNVVIAEGRLDFRIKPPQLDRASGTARDPLRLRVWPPVASLEQLWDARATLEIQGPSDSRARCSVTLEDRDGDTRHSRARTFSLPVDSVAWSDFFQRECREQKEFIDAYDDAAALTVVAEDEEIGRVRQRFDREIHPLRWIFRYRGGEPTLRLRESADTGDELCLTYSSFETPGTRINLPTGQDNDYYPAGGLFIATLGTYEAAIVVPRRVHDLHDLGLPKVRTPPVERSPDGVRILTETSQRWREARSPGDLLASRARDAVLSTLVRDISALIGGPWWRTLEMKRSSNSGVSLQEWVDALAKPGAWSQFRREVAVLAADVNAEPPIGRFSTLLQGGGPTTQSGQRVISSRRPQVEVEQPAPASLFDVDSWVLAEFLLRLASSPGSLDPGSSLAHDLASAALDHPVVYRAARLLAVQSVDGGVEWEW